MDWLILIVGVPAILIPLVLLFGFTGCCPVASVCVDDIDCPLGTICVDGACVAAGDPGDDPDEPPPPLPLLAPVNLAATAIDDHSVLLTWTNNDISAIRFQIERAEDGDEPLPIIVQGPISPAGTIDDDNTAGLPEGVTFVYRVVAQGDGVPDSDPSDISSATVLPATPAQFTATAAAIDRIDLSWTNASVVATEFRVEHRVPGGTFTEITPGRITANTFSHDPGLDQGTQHEYQVFAVVDGFENGQPQEVRSVPAIASAAFTAAFATPLGAQALDQPGLEGNCVIQRLSPALLTAAGTQVRLLLRGSTTGSLTLDRITISQVGNTGDPYDAAPDLTDVTPGVTTIIAPNATATVGPVNYTLDPTKELLVAFDVSTTANEGNARLGTLVGNDTYFNSATAEAGVQDRTTGYTFSQSLHVLVEIIQVF